MPAGGKQYSDVGGGLIFFVSKENYLFTLNQLLQLYTRKQLTEELNALLSFDKRSSHWYKACTCCRQTNNQDS